MGVRYSSDRWKWLSCQLLEERAELGDILILFFVFSFLIFFVFFYEYYIVEGTLLLKGMKNEILIFLRKVMLSRTLEIIYLHCFLII